MTDPPLAAEVQPLAPLLGTWRGEGKGEYPSIEPFAYGEEVRFWHVGKPFLAYAQRTWRLDTGLPSHTESGYWRPAGDGRIEVVLAHATGMVEVAEGDVRTGTGTEGQSGTRIEVRTTAVARTATAKDVTALERRLHVDGDTLTYQLAMAAMGQPLTHHLRAELHRAE